VSIYPYNPEATYLLCSDGLSDYLDHNLIQEVLNQPLNIEAKAHTLLKAALNTEAKDNITFILLNTSSPETG
jgi:serine/threonine protein phosphatase PrpC